MKNKKVPSLSRAIVLSEIAKNSPVAIHTLQKLTKLPRSTLIHHLEQLKFDNLILEKNALEIYHKKKIGSPIYLITNKANNSYLPFLKLCNKVRNLFKE